MTRNDQKKAYLVKTVKTIIGRCKVCGETRLPTLEFDHLNPEEKKRRLTTGKRMRESIVRAGGFQTILNEMKKCQVLCSFCHNTKSFSPVYRKIKRNKRYIQFVMDNKIKIGSCKSCAKKVTDKNYCCFQFDHIDPHTKSYTIANMRSKSQDLISAEIAKCQLLCANCHAIKTHKERAANASPNTLTAADKQKLDGMITTSLTEWIQVQKQD